MQDDIERDKSGRPLPNGPRNIGGGGVGGGGGGGGNVGDLRGNNRMQGPDDFQWDNTYGLSPQFLESLNIRGPLINRIFVANVTLKYFSVIFMFNSLNCFSLTTKLMKKN